MNAAQYRYLVDIDAHIAEQCIQTGCSRLEMIRLQIDTMVRWNDLEALHVLREMERHAYAVEERAKHPTLTDAEFDCWLQLNS